MRILTLDGRPTSGPAAVAIGNFDGVHRGHRQVIGRVIEAARALGVPPAIMTFEPYPREYFLGADAPPRLTSCRHKFELLASAGVERVYCVRFGRRLASTSAENFIDDILVGRLCVAHVVVGADFRFGKGRAGDVSLIESRAREHGFAITAVDDFGVDGERVSSSRIRGLLSMGELDAAARLLGRRFSYKSRVIHGDKRGREWGFPTANLAVSRSRFPVQGVFVVELDDGGGRVHAGVANVGRRPTVHGTRLLVEVHLFDFDGNLYGRRVEVTFLHRIRDERRFDGFDALKAQIRRDIDAARYYLEGRRLAPEAGRG